jgi:hypothetical protein
MPLHPGLQNVSLEKSNNWRKQVVLRVPLFEFFSSDVRIDLNKSQAGVKAWTLH